MNEIRSEIEVINAESRRLHAISPEKLTKLIDAQNKLNDSNIPTIFNGINQMNSSLYIGFATQEDADKYKPAIEDLINVPYYIEIGIETNY